MYRPKFFLYLCICVCKRDDIQLYGCFFSILLDYLCAFIYCIHVCPGPARFFLWQHLQTYSTEDVQTLNLWAREQRAAKRPEHWMVPDKNGTIHGEPLGTADLLSSDKMHIALILQWLWHNPAPPSFSLWSIVCHHGSWLWEMSCIKITNTKYRKKYSPGV